MTKDTELADALAHLRTVLKIVDRWGFHMVGIDVSRAIDRLGEFANSREPKDNDDHAEKA